jgi:hypothetical protein
VIRFGFPQPPINFDIDSTPWASVPS